MSNDHTLSKKKKGKACLAVSKKVKLTVWGVVEKWKRSTYQPSALELINKENNNKETGEVLGVSH